MLSLLLHCIYSFDTFLHFIKISIDFRSSASDEKQVLQTIKKHCCSVIPMKSNLLTLISWPFYSVLSLRHVSDHSVYIKWRKKSNKVQLQVLKSQKSVRYPSPKRHPADEQQHKYFNSGIENALGGIGKNNLDFKIILYFFCSLYFPWPNATKYGFCHYFK